MSSDATMNNATAEDAAAGGSAPDALPGGEVGTPAGGDTAATAATEDAEDAAGKGRAPLDRKVVQKVARALWQMEFKERSPAATAEERKEAWAAGKKDARLRARKFLRKLESDNLVVTVAERPAPGAAAG